MKATNLIGLKITDIYVWYRCNINGLDFGEVILELNSEKLIKIPWDFDSEIFIVSETKISILDKISNLFGKNLLEHKNSKTNLSEYKKVKSINHIRNKKIIDFIMIEDSDNAGFILLENGYLVSETYAFPTGAAAAGLTTYNSLKDFDEEYDCDYLRLTKQ